MNLSNDLETLRTEAEAAFAAVGDPQALEAVRVEFLGTRGKLKQLLGRMGEVAKEDRPAVGKLANQTSAQIQAAFETAQARISAASPAAASGEPGAVPAEGNAYATLRQERLDKLRRYEAALGPGSAWGARYPDVASIEALRKKFPPLAEGEAGKSEQSFGRARLAGRVMLRRDQSKKLIFLTVQDQGGTIQVALWNQKLDETRLALLRDTLDLWDVVGVEGDLAYTQKGEPTLWATDARILSKCIAPPPDKHHGIHDKEIRYRQRHLDLIATPESRQTFVLRARAVSAVRRYLDERGFLEMETPVLQTIPGGAAARPFETKLNALDMKMYLRIATEIPLKKLLVGGLERVYELGRIFRNEGIDYYHNPEFTTVELYQAYGDLRDMMAVTEGVVSHLAETLAGSGAVNFRGRSVKLAAPWPRLEYGALLQKHAGVRPDDERGLEAKLQEKGRLAPGMTLVEKIDGVFGEYVEPHLQDACFVINPPVEMSPLCRAHPDHPELADRFEAFAGGMEIANAYSELNDPIEQRKRLAAQPRDLWRKILGDLLGRGINENFNSQLGQLGVTIKINSNWIPDQSAQNLIQALLDEKDPKVVNSIKEYRENLKRLLEPESAVDEDFLGALEHGMPPAGGLGIGIDRVVMLLSGNDSIRDVILFPLMRPEQ